MLNTVVPMEKNTLVEKQCSDCKQILPISKFRRSKNQPGSFVYRSSCRECEKAQSRERYQKKTQLDVDNDEKPDIFRFMELYKKVKGG